METLTEETTSVTEATDEECYQAALEWVNALRGEYEVAPLEDLRPGQKGSPVGCALALSLAELGDGSAPVPCRGRNSGSGYTHARDGEVHNRPIPSLVSEFGRRFDQGRYPHLSVPF